MLKALSTVAMCAALTACVDPRKSFDDYGTRIVDGNTSMPDRPDLSAIPDVNGHFYFGVHANGTAASTLILLVGDFTMTKTNDKAMVSYSAATLKTADKKESTGGDPCNCPPPQFGAQGMEVGSDGTFTAALAGKLPGDANPVQPGVQIDVQGVLHGELRSADLICGKLTGTAGPISLDGSTFAAIRIDAGVIGDALPKAESKCPN